VAVGLGVFAAFASGQVGLAAHDLGRGQAARLRPFVFDLAACFTMLVLGMSRAWWVDKHNRHHAFPHQEGKDPDVMIEAIAFTPEQALERKGLIRLLARYQVFLFFPLVMLEAVQLRVEGCGICQACGRVEIALILLSIAGLALPIAAPSASAPGPSLRWSRRR
jgi:fatty acid desaturase